MYSEFLFRWIGLTLIFAIAWDGIPRNLSRALKGAAETKLSSYRQNYRRQYTKGKIVKYGIQKN